MRIDISGDTELIKGLKERMQLDLVKRVVKQNGSELDRGMKREAVFKRFTPMAPRLYSTGQTKRRITTEISDGGLTSTTKPGTHYSPYVEYGTSRMTAQPFVRPAFNAQKEKFKADMDKIVK